MPPGDPIPIWRSPGNRAFHQVHPGERNRSGALKILLSAAETSSDVHGAAVLRALRELRPDIDVFGIGGPELQKSGLRAVVSAQELQVMGSSEVLARLPRILRAMNRLVEAARREKPDVAVLLDYPDFHLRLAPRLRALGIPLVYYIPPKVWIWRRSRVKRIRELFSRVLSIFPMEEEFLRKHHVPVVYVGNPLLDELPFQRTRGEARRALGLSETERTLVMMPGSRPAEIRMLLERMLDSAEEARKRLAGELTVLLPFAENANLPELDERVKLWKRSREAGLQIRLSRGNAHECLIAADAGLIKSGTSTLEAALLGCPHSITYRFNALSSWLFYNLVRYRGPVGLSNILFGWEKGKPLLVHEVVLKDATVSQLSAEIVTLFTDEEYRRRMKEGFATLREKLSGPGTSPSSEAARQILEVAQ